MKPHRVRERAGESLTLPQPLNPLPPSDGRPLCQRCYGGPAVAIGRCERCAKSWKRDQIADCQVPIRHRKFDRWDHLRGSDRYMTAVGKLRAQTESGQGVVAVLGPRGTGKTQAACVGILQSIESYRRAVYVTATDVLSCVFEDGGSDKWMLKWCSPSLLVIDEVGNWEGLGRTLQAMRDALIDHRYAAMRPTVLIGNIKAKALGECVGDSAVDRTHDGGGIIEFAGWPSFRERPEQSEASA